MSRLRNIFKGNDTWECIEELKNGTIDYVSLNKEKNKEDKNNSKDDNGNDKDKKDKDLDLIKLQDLQKLLATKKEESIKDKDRLLIDIDEDLYDDRNKINKKEENITIDDYDNFDFGDNNEVGNFDDNYYTSKEELEKSVNQKESRKRLASELENHDEIRKLKTS